MWIVRALSFVAVTATTFVTQRGQAETTAQEFTAAVAELPDGGTRILREFGHRNGTTLLVRTQGRQAALAQGLIPIVDDIAVGHRKVDELGALDSAPGIDKVLLSPPRFPLMDRASNLVHLDAAHDDSGLLGEGTIIGIVDTGADVAHPAFRDANGRTRIAWMLLFGEEPRGLHPQLEELYGCLGDEPCAVLSREDIDALLGATGSRRLPNDPVGHGTHIASLAAGSDPDYPGVAPLSDLVIVAASDETGGVSDAHILLGTKFVFDRADELLQPAVVNVSLGSSFGAHDGSSAVEQGLAELGRGEGRAIIVAAGNSGEILRGVSAAYPEPFGVHTEVTVLPSSTVRVPVLTPDNDSDLIGSLFVWISTRPGDSLSVGFHNGRGEETSLIAPGESGSVASSEMDDDDDYDVILLNGENAGLDADVEPGSLVVAVAGRWKSGRTFELMLEGHGNARLWVTGTGTLAPHISHYGPVFPRARRAGTVAVPGSHSDLITVGATVNRTEWTDFTDQLVGYEGPVDVRSTFSAAGPNQKRHMKPELVAPGSGVIGAMARAADPRRDLGTESLFSSYGNCPEQVECFVIDDEHGIASGTSMAAPIVTGAVALLMQRDPTLTMEKAKHFLMAGAQAVPASGIPSLVGTGGLDIRGALHAQELDLEERKGSSSDADVRTSRVVWADDFLYPGTGPGLEGFLLTRDGEDRPLDIDPDEISLSLLGPARAEAVRVAPGLTKLLVIAQEESLSREVTVRVSLGGQLVSSDTFVVERDPTLAKHGYEVMGGTCASFPFRNKLRLSPWSFVPLIWFLRRRRKTALH